MDGMMNVSLEAAPQCACKNQRLWKRLVSCEIMYMDFYNGYKT